jgi:uncharacterized membrane protein YdjX (TVP38/TMEM64 family)
MRKMLRTNRIKISASGFASVATLLTLVLGCVLLLANLGVLNALLDGARDIFSSPGSVKEFVEGFGAWSLMAFLLVQAAQVVAGPVPAAPVIVAGSALFGFWKGLALSMTGVVSGSVCAFLLGRRFGHPLLRVLHGEETLARHHAIPTGSDGWWLLMVLLLPIPAGGDAACAQAGMSSISLRRFILVVSIGRLPGTALAAFVGAGLVSGHAPAAIASGLTALALVGVTLRYRRRLKMWLVPSGRATIH